MHKILHAGIALALLVPVAGRAQEATADALTRPLRILSPNGGEPTLMRRALPYHSRKVQPLPTPVPTKCDFACWFFNRPDAGDYTPPPVQPAPDPPIPPQPW